MPHNTEHWDSMREYEQRIKQLREQAQEEGIELSEDSISNLMSFLSDLTPAEGGNNPSRLSIHKTPAAADDEWQIPHLEKPEQG